MDFIFVITLFQVNASTNPHDRQHVFENKYGMCRMVDLRSREVKSGFDMKKYLSNHEALLDFRPNYREYLREKNNSVQKDVWRKNLKRYMKQKERALANDTSKDLESKNEAKIPDGKHSGIKSPDSSFLVNRDKNVAKLEIDRRKGSDQKIVIENEKTEITILVSDENTRKKKENGSETKEIDVSRSANTANGAAKHDSDIANLDDIHKALKGGDMLENTENGQIAQELHSVVDETPIRLYDTEATNDVTRQSNLDTAKEDLGENSNQTEDINDDYEVFDNIAEIDEKKDTEIATQESLHSIESDQEIRDEKNKDKNPTRLQHILERLVKGRLGKANHLNNVLEGQGDAQTNVISNEDTIVIHEKGIIKNPASLTKNLNDSRLDLGSFGEPNRLSNIDEKSRLSDIESEIDENVDLSKATSNHVNDYSSDNEMKEQGSINQSEDGKKRYKRSADTSKHYLQDDLENLHGSKNESNESQDELLAAASYNDIANPPTTVNDASVLDMSIANMRKDEDAMKILSMYDNNVDKILSVEESSLQSNNDQITNVLHATNNSKPVVIERVQDSIYEDDGTLCNSIPSDSNMPTTHGENDETPGDDKTVEDDDLNISTNKNHGKSFLNKNTTYSELHKNDEQASESPTESYNHRNDTLLEDGTEMMKSSSEGINIVTGIDEACHEEFEANMSHEAKTENSLQNADSDVQEGSSIKPHTQAYGSYKDASEHEPDHNYTKHSFHDQSHVLSGQRSNEFAFNDQNIILTPKIYNNDIDPGLVINSKTNGIKTITEYNTADDILSYEDLSDTEEFFECNQSFVNDEKDQNIQDPADEYSKKQNTAIESQTEGADTTDTKKLHNCQIADPSCTNKDTDVKNESLVSPLLPTNQKVRERKDSQSSISSTETLTDENNLEHYEEDKNVVYPDYEGINDDTETKEDDLLDVVGTHSNSSSTEIDRNIDKIIAPAHSNDILECNMPTEQSQSNGKEEALSGDEKISITSMNLGDCALQENNEQKEYKTANLSKVNDDRKENGHLSDSNTFVKQNRQTTSFEPAENDLDKQNPDLDMITKCKQQRAEEFGKDTRNFVSEVNNDILHTVQTRENKRQDLVASDLYNLSQESTSSKSDMITPEVPAHANSDHALHNTKLNVLNESHIPVENNDLENVENRVLNALEIIPNDHLIPDASSINTTLQNRADTSIPLHTDEEPITIPEKRDTIDCVKSNIIFVDKNLKIYTNKVPEAVLSDTHKDSMHALNSVLINDCSLTTGSSIRIEGEPEDDHYTYHFVIDKNILSASNEFTDQNDHTQTKSPDALIFKNAYKRVLSYINEAKEENNNEEDAKLIDALNAINKYLYNSEVDFDVTGIVNHIVTENAESDLTAHKFMVRVKRNSKYTDNQKIEHNLLLDHSKGVTNAYDGIDKKMSSCDANLMGGDENDKEIEYVETCVNMPKSISGKCEGNLLSFGDKNQCNKSVNRISCLRQEKQENSKICSADVKMNRDDRFAPDIDNYMMLTDQDAAQVTGPIPVIDTDETKDNSFGLSLQASCSSSENSGHKQKYNEHIKPVDLSACQSIDHGDDFASFQPQTPSDQSEYFEDDFFDNDDITNSDIDLIKSLTKHFDIFKNSPLESELVEKEDTQDSVVNLEDNSSTDVTYQYEEPVDNAVANSQVLDLCQSDEAKKYYVLY